MDRDLKLALGLTTLALAIRVAFIPTSALQLNPYSVSDAPGMIATAQAVRDGLLSGGINWPRASQTYRLWGSLLSPFWFLPGPSATYARLGMAVCSSLIVYNVYWITRHYAGRQAAAFAVLPFLVYPSLVLLGATVRRETMVIFGITTVARLLLARPQRLSSSRAVAIALPVAILTLVLRPDNLPVYLLAIASGGLVHAYMAGYPTLARAGGAAGVAAGIVAIPLGIVEEGIRFLATIRSQRAVGRAAYLPDAIPQGLLDAIGFAPIGALFFMFAPLPWQIETIPDIVAGVEGVLNILFGIGAIFGFRVLFHRSRPATVALATFLVSGSLFYGLAEGNFGAVVRHRQSFIWTLFLFGSVGLSNEIMLKRY